MTARHAAVIVAAGVIAAAARGEVRDPAELFPAGTLAYAEVAEPARTADAVARLLAGSVLADSIPFVHDRRDKIKIANEIAGQEAVSMAGVFASPEALAELRRVRGVAVGLAGFTDKHDPLLAAVVLTGDSHAAGLLARAYLTANTDFRRVDTVDGVPVFQKRRFGGPVYDNSGNLKPLSETKPGEGTAEPTYAYTPGVVVVGSNKAAVADVLRRFAGKVTAPSLASGAAFRRAAGRREPGLFFHLTPPALTAKLDAAAKAKNNLVDPDWYAVLKMVANAKAFPSVSGHVAVTDDGFRLAATAAADPAQVSPLLSVLDNSAAIAAPPAGMPTDAVATWSVSLPPGGSRVAAVMAVADAVAKANGVLGRMPSQTVPDVESKTGVRLRDELIARTKAVTVVYPRKQELPPNAPDLPMLVLHADADAAAWEAALPKLFAVAAGAAKPAEPAGERIGGVSVRSLPADAAPWKAPVHYARNEAVLVVGLDRKLVAAYLGTAAKVPAVEPLVGSVRLGPLLADALKLNPPPSAAPGRTIRRVGGVNPPPEPEKPKEPEVDPVRELTAALDALPPATVRAGREKDGLRVEARLSAPAPARNAVIEKAVLWAEAFWVRNRPQTSGPAGYYYSR